MFVLAGIYMHSSDILHSERKIFMQSYDEVRAHTKLVVSFVACSISDTLSPAMNFHGRRNSIAMVGIRLCNRPCFNFHPSSQHYNCYN